MCEELNALMPWLSLELNEFVIHKERKMSSEERREAANLGKA
jgi:hypothetical protein